MMEGGGVMFKYSGESEDFFHGQPREGRCNDVAQDG